VVLGSCLGAEYNPCVHVALGLLHLGLTLPAHKWRSGSAFGFDTLSAQVAIGLCFWVDTPSAHVVLELLPLGGHSPAHTWRFGSIGLA
jgi:hypothetical protein